MPNLIDITAYPVVNVLGRLLDDKTTKKNIIWATDTYEAYGSGYMQQDEIQIDKLLSTEGPAIIPRTAKGIDDQSDRTKKKAEVFTPSWVCNKMNNHCDEDWFGKPNLFNSEQDTFWVKTEDRIPFKNDEWKAYIDSRRLEITCGEAPFVVSRYDASTGDYIEIPNRIGILDRKLRVLNENAEIEDEWLVWCERAFQSVYGYEWQGDNLLLARVNLLLTFTEYLEDRWKRQATNKELQKIATIISWNFWQMDGLTHTIPYGVPIEEYETIVMDNEWESIFGEPEEVKKNKTPLCKIWDWRRENAVMFDKIKRRTENEV